MVKVAIVRAVRTAIGSFGGVLREFSADQLATVFLVGPLIVALLPQAPVVFLQLLQQILLVQYLPQ